MYGMVLGAIAIIIICVFLRLFLCPFPGDEETNSTAQPNTRAQSFMRSLPTTSQMENTYLPPSHEEVTANTCCNCQGQLQRIPTIDITTDRISSMNPPTTENSQYPSINQNCSPEVHLNILPSAPPAKAQELQEIPPAVDLPPAYE